MAFYRKLKERLGKVPLNTAVIVAAGSSSRMGQDKLTIPLAGKTVMERTLQAFEDCELVHEIIIVTREDRLEEMAALGERMGLEKLRQVVVGGSTRAGSSLAGVSAASRSAALIGIHDAARPLVTPEGIAEVYRAAADYQAAAPILPLKDTVKELKDGKLVSTPARDGLAAVQTPQVFQADLIRAALHEAVSRSLPITDDCSAVEQTGLPIHAVDGWEENIKITTPLDVALAEEILRRRGSMRIGHGYDVHRLVPGRKLILGGVEIPHGTGLLGHSDADVLTHALMDALLGAAALGDIGHLFPDSDPAYEGADSIALLREVTRRMTEAGYRLSNADITILAQAPKLAPHIEDMRRNLADAMGCAVSQVSIKATTEEGLGFTGAKEGIAAHTVVLVESVF